MQLPDIRTYLAETEKQGFQMKDFTFVKPSHKELVVLYTEDSKISPASDTLRLMNLTLPGKTIIPFHGNPLKSKMYELKKGSYVSAFILRNEGMERYLMQPDRPLIIPTAAPHAIVNYALEPCEIFIVASSQVDDCEWQRGLEELLKNAHRQ